MKSESKHERFKRVAERRTRKVLRDLRVLGNCGNRSNYSYTQDEAKKIFAEVEEAVKEAKAKFHAPSSKDKEFKL